MINTVIELKTVSMLGCQEGRWFECWLRYNDEFTISSSNFIFHHGEKFNNLSAEKEKQEKSVCVWKSSVSHFTISNTAEGNLIRTGFMRCLTPLPQHRVSRHHPLSCFIFQPVVFLFCSSPVRIRKLFLSSSSLSLPRLRYNDAKLMLR